MKQLLTQCAGIALTMLTAIAATSCGGLTDITEASFDLVRHRYTGTSYETADYDDYDIGFNVSYKWVINLLPGKKKTSFLQPDEYTKYQIAYTSRTQVLSAFPRYNSYEGSLGYTRSQSKFMDHLRLMTGLEFVQKNSKDEGTKIRLNYLQVPIIALYNHDLDDERKIFGGLGPYFAYGVGGKIKGDGFSESAFDEDFGFKRFDAGLTFTAGYKFHKKWSVRLGYDLGLANIEHNSFDKAKNRGFSVNIGYWPHLIEKLTKK